MGPTSVFECFSKMRVSSVPASGGRSGRRRQPVAPGAASIVYLLLAATPMAALAQTTITPVVTFNGANGATPVAALIQGTDGNFYGTTSFGGATSTNGTGSDASGAIFEITPSGTYTLLYSFTGGTDGSVPAGALYQGDDGNFYGTTSGNNGQNGSGTIFRFKPGTGTTGTLTTLYTFTGAADGGVPLAGLVEDSNGNFWGTTSVDGTGSAGTVFMINADHELTTVYPFCSSPNCTDGSTPADALIVGPDGNFYGTAANGGTSGFGTAFRITPAGALTTLHSFTGMGSEGGTPLGALVLGADFNFYGTTQQGGTTGNNGTVFQMDSSGNVVSWDLTLANGSHPAAALVEGGTSLRFYGTAASGGSTGDGTVFQLAVVATGGGGDRRSV